MKRLLAISLTLAMVLTAVTAFAFDNQRVAAPAQDLQMMEQSLGGMHPKDACWIWCDNLTGWVWIFTAGWFGPGCGMLKYVNPDECYTDCLPPYYPFNIESYKFGVHVYDWPGPDYFDVAFYVSVHEALPEPGHACGFTVGAEVFRSEDIMFSLPPGWYGWFSITAPSVWTCGPFFVDWHVTYVTDMGYFGWLTDNTEFGTTPCWNWLNAHCLYYYDTFLEMYYDLGWLEGNLLFGVDGRPEWNVAVDMGSFEAVPGDGMITLNWQSLSETNNAKWIVERNGEKIAEYAGQGNKEAATDYLHVDRNVTNGVSYSYTITAVNYDGNEDVYGPVTATPFAAGVPSEFALSQNYPNPFNASTVIRYRLATDEHVNLKVYNIYGQEVASLVEADQKAGQYTVQWNGEGISSGVYFYTLNAGDFSETKKMVFTK